jgi:hypothetical protein
MNDKNDKLSRMDFGEALQRFAQTDPKEVAIVTNASIKDGEIERLIAAFERAAHLDEDGTEYWLARDLQLLLEYERWESFEAAIARGEKACELSGQPVENHFREVTKKVQIGSSAERGTRDVRLTRYACYLITQNGDARKKPVAFGQTYFAIQTRRQELSDQAAVAVPLSEDEKRVFLRNQIKEHNRHLSNAAKGAGVVTPQEFAIFHSHGYQGLYGKTVPQIRRYKGLPASADILDRMGSTELAANFFRVTQTEEKLRKDNIKGLKNAYDTHYAVGRQVRDAMLKISGIAPEDLPAAESIAHAQKRLKAETRDLQSPVAPPAPLPSQTEVEPEQDRRPVNLRTDLWKFALLVMAMRPSGEISTSDLIAELPNYIHVPDETQGALAGRADNKFSQLVRNLKSHKTAKTNFIYQGYAESIPDGFRITAKGREFVKEYFSGG